MDQHRSSDRPRVASYRLQLTPSFGFDAAAELLEPLRRLGVSHVYLSPIAEAIAGSEHGYDVVDHRVVRSEFGGDAGLQRLLDGAAAHDLGVVIDHVPNHVSVAAAEQNPQWWTMLRDGPESPAADWFDVDWELTDGTVIIPKLGDPIDDVTAAEGISTAEGPLGPELHVGSLRFPLAAGTEDLPLPDLLEAQHYRLHWWRDPARNVRRFFTIDDLVAVCVEHDHVATVVDTLPRRLCDHPAFAGVRVDHVDGLADPQRYLDGLRDLIGDRWLLVEKILGPGETLPRSWPVDGTTGYEHVTAVEHTLLDPAAERPLDDLWDELVGAGSLETPDFDSLEHTARAEVLDGGLRPDLERTIRAVTATTGSDGTAAQEAVVALTLALGRYRTYLPDDDVSAQVLDEITASAVDRRPDLAAVVGDVADAIRSDEAVRVRWQQLTGPAMAKGAEDRAFYRHQRLSALCEVGGNPGTWTLTTTAFHDQKRRVAEGWPTTMLTATTHDTKRSEAVRSRSLALATIADEWADAVREWLAAHGDLVDGVRAADVSLALQTVATASPLTTERLHAYLVKSAREADLDTSWTETDAGYEQRLGVLAETLVDERADPASMVARFSDRVETPGASIGLLVLALQLTCPGVPDLYQGAPAELRSLVDPDNRRPPDWDRWSGLVDRAVDGDGPIDSSDPDRARTALVHRALRLRRRHPDAFGATGGYDPLETVGADADRVIAFARTAGDGRSVAVTIVVRPSGIPGVDAEVRLPPGRWRSLLDGTTVAGRDGFAVGVLAGDSGVAVLESVG